MKVYFTKGMVPTDDEKKEADALEITAFRNSSKGQVVEKGVDGVAGTVPEAYLKVKKIQVLGEAAKKVPPAKKPDGK